VLSEIYFLTLDRQHFVKNAYNEFHENPTNGLADYTESRTDERRAWFLHETFRCFFVGKDCLKAIKLVLCGEIMAVGSDVEIHTRHTDTLLTERTIFFNF
jgi:hypothetical protein